MQVLSLQKEQRREVRHILHKKSKNHKQDLLELEPFSLPAESADLRF